MVESISALIILVILLIGAVIYIRADQDKEFRKWFDKILLEGKKRNMSDAEIDELEEAFFYDFFVESMEPNEALTQYLEKYA